MLVIGCGALNGRILVNGIFVLAGQLEFAFTQRERFRSAKLLVLCVSENFLDIFDHFMTHIARCTPEADGSERNVNRDGNRRERMQPVHERTAAENDNSRSGNSHGANAALNNRIIVVIIQIKINKILFGDIVMQLHFSLPQLTRIKLLYRKSERIASLIKKGERKC